MHFNSAGGFHQEERAVVPRVGADDQVQKEGRDPVALGFRLPVPHPHLPASEVAERGLGLSLNTTVTSSRSSRVMGMMCGLADSTEPI